MMIFLPHCNPFRLNYGSVEFDTCTVVSVNETLVEAKMCTFALESTHFIFIRYPIYTHDDASAKFSTYSNEMDNSALCKGGVRFISRTE
jgi:hypothetical protein